MADYNRKPQLMLRKGMNVTLPGDRLSQEWFQYARNVRSYKLGEYRQRPGMILLYPSIAQQIYHAARLNNNIDGTFRRFVGTTAGEIFVDNAGHTLLSSVDSGYSATGYTSIVARPDRSPLPFWFVANSARQSKFSTTGARTEWGLAAPVDPPLPFLGFRPTNLLSGAPAASFTSVNAVLTDQTRVSTTVTFVLADGALPGMASIVPAAMSENFGIGMEIAIDNGITIILTIVRDVFQPIDSTSISAIAYDSGTTGLCTIQLATTTTGLRKDSLVRLNATENVRVLSVTDGLDGLPSFRCSTVGTFGVGNSVDGLRSFRVDLPTTVSPGNPITNAFVQIAVSAAGIASATQPISISMASAGGRPLQPEDLIHVGLRVSNFALITEIQLQFDCDISTNDFTRNYFFKSLRQPDLQSAISQAAFPTTAQQTQIQREQVDRFTKEQLKEEREFFALPPPPLPDTELFDLQRQSLDQINRALGSGFDIGQDEGPISGQGSAGSNQWSQLFIPMAEFQRVGSDKTRGWGDVVSFRISINTTGTPIIGFDTLWVGGTYGPNTVELPGYSYVYVARNSATGTQSNPSPPTRSPILPFREAVYFPAPVYPDSQADVFDYYRIGGTLTNYHYVGTQQASSQFQDSIADSVARKNVLLEVDKFKPWPISDLPHSGLCTVVGTRVLWVSGDQFDTGWVRGTQITIRDRTYSLYSNPSSVTALDLNESGGSQISVPFRVQDPLFDAQPLPAVFGPYVGAGGEFIFACGSTINPGYLYFTNGNDPESASDENLIELCNPGEKLMNGVALDGIIFCFSDKRSWRILPSFEGGQSGAGASFYAQETAMGKGMAGRFGICVGDAIYFVSFDGIYRSRGDAVESLTDDSLAPLFNRDGTFITEFTVPVSPVNFSAADDISLTYSFDGIYFTFRGRDNNLYTFFFSFLTTGWVLDSIQTGSIVRSLRELRSSDADNVLVGTTGGKLMIRSAGAFLDDADAIDCRIWDREEIWEDIRLTKQVGDLMIDINPAGATVTPTTRYDNNEFNDVLATMTGAVRDQFVRDINSGSGRVARGVALDLTWTNGTSGSPRLYAWEPAALVKSEEQVNRATDWDNGGYPGTKWLQGFRLRGDTAGVPKSFQIETDGGTFVESFVLTAAGEQVTTFWLTNPVVAHEFRLRGADADSWRNMGVEWIFEPEPEMAAVWETQVTSFDLPFFHHIRELMVAHRSTADITMSVITDGVTNVYTIPHGSGDRVRSYLPVKALKAKYHKFRFTSAAPFGLWMADIECRVGAWGRTDPYTIQRPFGDISRQNGGARI